MSSPTHATLLERLRDGADPLAWDEFFARYWRLIYSFARHRGCSDHTAEEIVQEAMLAVFQQREVFQYSPALGRFRDWLSGMVRRLVTARRRKPSERVRGEGGDPAAVLAEAPADCDAPDAAWEAAFEETLLATLLDVVRREVTPETFQAFELLALHDLPGAQVAEITGLTRNAVYLARKRVLARLRELGAAYRDDGQLDEHIRQALRSVPAAVQRSVTARVERTMQ